MKKIIIGVYGASGFGREVMPIVLEQQGVNAEVCFIDDAMPAGENITKINSYSCITFEEFNQIDINEKYVTIAIADSLLRAKLEEKVLHAGIKLLNVKANNVTILDCVDLSAGYILCPHVTLTSNIKIGKQFQANLYSYVGHDCIIGDYVTFAPGVKCNGNVIIEDNVYIGTGAIIKQGTPKKPMIIGKGSIIAAGAVVIKPVDPGKTVFGNPAIEFTKENIKKRS